MEGFNSLCEKSESCVKVEREERELCESGERRASCFEMCNVFIVVNLYMDVVVEEPPGRVVGRGVAGNVWSVVPMV